jgi:RNA polymerase sigma-70 factor, ECF subfamily
MGTEVVYAEERFRRPPEPQAPGDRARFEQILARHHRRLRRAVAGILADRDGVDDVLQEGYLKAYLKLPRSFANEAHEAAWLSRVVTRCALDETRRRGRRREVRMEVVVAHDDAHVRLELEDVFRALDPRDRAILMLLGVLELDQSTAARILGMPRGTLAWRLHEARRRLQP